jgi:hypothetical protein
MKQIIEKFNNYFVNSFELSNMEIDITQTNLEHITFHDKELNIYFHLDWNEFVEKDNTEYFHKKYKTQQELDSFFKHPSISKGYSRSTKDLKIFTNKILPSNNRYNAGFYTINYSEFFIRISDRAINYIDNNSGIEFLYNFSIGNVKISISQPSNSFKHICKCLENTIDFNSWEHCTTLSFKGSHTSKEINDYLQEVFFLINANEELIKLGYNKYYENYTYRYYLNSDKIFHFPKAHYIEPISFFNESLNLTSETRFHYYYKVLEYFFHINLNNKILSNKRKVSISLQELRNINKTSEKECLKELLNNKNICNNVKQVISEYFTPKLLPCNYKGNTSINTLSIEDFSELLYDYRNSIVHGKYQMRIPNLIENNEIIEEWNEIVKTIALICIVHFCYDDNKDVIKLFENENVLEFFN